MFHSARFEWLYPFLLAILGAVAMASGSFLQAIPQASELNQLFAAAINVAGIGIGFLATMKAVLLGMKTSRTVRGLRKMKRWTGVLVKIRNAILWSFLAAMVSGSVLLVKPLHFASIGWLNLLALAVFGFCAGGAIGASHVVIDLLFTIVEMDEASTSDA